MPGATVQLARFCVRYCGKTNLRANFGRCSDKLDGSLDNVGRHGHMVALTANQDLKDALERRAR